MALSLLKLVAIPIKPTPFRVLSDDLSKRTSVYSIWGRGTGCADASFANRGAFTYNAGGASTTNVTVGMSHSF
jgi:hypothetical protein